MARSVEKPRANTLLFPFHDCCVSGAKAKTRPEYTEVKQEDSMDDIAEEKPDLKKSEGKSQWALSAIKLIVTFLLSETQRYLLYILRHFFQLQISRRGGTVFLTKRQRLLWTWLLKRKPINLAQVSFEYYINFWALGFRLRFFPPPRREAYLA